MITESPKTYQQWTQQLLYLQEHPKDKSALQLISQGHFSEPVSENLKERISQTVSVLLGHRFRNFLRSVDQALSDGEPEMVCIYASRFRTEVDQCLFYHRLEFLDAPFVQTLDSGYFEQIRSFWSGFLRQLRRTARDSMNPDLEDLSRKLGRKGLI